MINLKSTFFRILFIAFVESGFSQYTVSGTATDTNQVPLAFANVLLLQANDSTELLPTMMVSLS